MENAKNKHLTEWAVLYTKDLLKYAYFKVSNYEDAKDLVQDTYEVAIENYKNFENKSSPKTWLFGILNNKIKEYYKKLNKVLSIQTKEAEEEFYFQKNFFDEDGNWIPEKMPKEWATTESENLLDNEEFLKVLEFCLNQLPERWKDCLVMKYIENMTWNDICLIHSISQTNFWQIIHRAKLQLRNCLDINWFNKNE